MKPFSAHRNQSLARLAIPQALPDASPQTASAAAKGFSLLDLLYALAILAILACIGWATYQSSVLKTRRTDALTALMQIQLAQERYRANHTTYAQLPALNLPDHSTQGHYLLEVTHAAASSYRLLATAQGAQLGDKTCRYLEIRMNGMNQVRTSGSTMALDNLPADNRQCWAQ